jgi:hypothetical protein
VPETITALCGVPSFCSKFMTLLLRGGMVSVAPPLVNPLKLNGPALSRKVTVFVAGSNLRYWLSAAAGEADGAVPPLLPFGAAEESGGLA